MKSIIKVINIEKGMPTVEVAEKRLMFEISTAKREGIKALKIIHGYGSSGVGGGIKGMVKKVLAAKRREGALKAFVSGEEWDIFNQSTRQLMDLCSELRNDKDLQNQNHGITIVLL
jgi:hypothetical protein